MTGVATAAATVPLRAFKSASRRLRVMGSVFMVLSKFDEDQSPSGTMAVFS